MRVPVVSGVTASENGNFLVSYPVNREPVLKDTGISEGYLAVPMGIRQVAQGFGADRGGINWNGTCYRVIGGSLVSIGHDWSLNVLGDVGDGGPCGFDYSFDYLIINSGTQLYHYATDTGVVRVTDPDLGNVTDVIYVDGYTMTTDGEFLVVNDLTDPFSISPLKYGSAEDSPDPVTGLVHMNGEVYAFGRYTTQVFQNVGGLGFPFQTIKTATVPYGCVGPRAKAKYVGTVAFVGSQENGAPAVYMLGSGDASAISSPDVDAELARLSEQELAEVWVEARVRDGDQRLIVHLPEKSWGFSAQVTKKSQVKTWCQYVSSTETSGRYEGRGAVYCYGEWIVGSSSGQVGVLDASTAQHYGQDVCWQFDTTLIYNEANRGILTGIELIGTPGRGNANSRVFWSYTKDGETWSMERSTSAGKLGQRCKRVAWRPGTRFEQYMGLRFRGVDGSLMAVARLECDIEPLA